MIKLLALTSSMVTSLAAHSQQPMIVQTLTTGGGENSPMVADVNGDGHADLLVAIEDSGLLGVFLGDGTLNFEPAAPLAVGDNPTALAAADLNQDGRLDLVVANHERPHFSVLLAGDGGSFSPPKQVAVNAQPHPHVVAATDLNADGQVDVLLDSRDQAGVWVLSGNGRGDLNSPGRMIDVQGAPYLGFALADLNGDGLIDLVTPNNHTVSVAFNSASADFTVRQTIDMPGAFAVGLADLNGDQHIDLIAAASGGAVKVFLGQGQGQLADQAAAQLHLGQGAKQLITGDFNGDGKDDAVVANWSGSLHLLSMLQDALHSQALDLGQINNPWGLSSGDLNGDGHAEIVLTDGTGNRLNIYAGQKR